jgi:oligopeptidase B
MKYLFFQLFLISLFVVSCSTGVQVKPPVAKKIAKELTIHGDTRIDNYYWLNDREDPEVIAYLEAENAYIEAVMKHTIPLQDKLFEEIKSKIKAEDESVPYKKNGFFYYSRTVPEKEYYLVCRKKDNPGAAEEVMLDVNRMAEGFEYYAIGGPAVRPDNKILAFGVDTLSRRIYTIYFKNLETGELLNDQIPLTAGGATWAADNKTVYYVLKDDVTLRSAKIMKHTLGTPSENDVEVNYEADETFSTFIFKTKSEKYLMIGSESTLTSEYRFLDAGNPGGEFKIIQPRTRGLEYQVEHFGNDFYIRTNLDAQNFRLMKTPVVKTGKENWTEVIAHRSDVFFEDFDIFKDYLVVSERKEGITQLRVLPWNGGEEYYIGFEEEVYTAFSNVNMEYDTEWFRFSYTSLTTPNSVFDFNMKTRERNLLKQEEILGGFDKNNYETRRIYATATDGTKIPMSLVYRKGLEKNGSNPALIYGYGSYG